MDLKSNLESEVLNSGNYTIYLNMNVAKID